MDDATRGPLLGLRDKLDRPPPRIQARHDVTTHHLEQRSLQVQASSLGLHAGACSVSAAESLLLRKQKQEGSWHSFQQGLAHVAKCCDAHPSHTCNSRISSSLASCHCLHHEGHPGVGIGGATYLYRVNKQASCRAKACPRVVIWEAYDGLWRHMGGSFLLTELSPGVSVGL